MIRHGAHLRTVVAAEGGVLQRILETMPDVGRQGLSPAAFVTYDTAIRKTAWARAHQRRWALADERGHVLASVQQCDLTGRLDSRPVQICGISAALEDSAHEDASHLWELVERIIDTERRAGADLALLSLTPGQASDAPTGFELIPTMDLELRVAESSRHGAPMTLVRDGDDRDLAAIVAMGEARAGSFRFHLDRDVDRVKHAVTNKRLLAGLSRAGRRQLWFVIAEEGITAAAYVVLTIAKGTWTIEECGDRDPAGARVGAILQALIAREPAECRPIIRAWLPEGFVPPQVTITSARQSDEVLMIKVLRPTIEPRLLGADLLYWRSDIL